jgi:hypothetical protein
MKAITDHNLTPTIEFINGDSHETLHEFFDGKYGSHPQEFDLISVDGDHSRLGAWWDLYDLFPHVRLGGHSFLMT